MRDSAMLSAATVAGIEMIETIKASGAENGYFYVRAEYPLAIVRLVNAIAEAEKYGFAYAELSPESDKKLSEYSDIIIQTTSVGMNSTEPSSSANDPIYFHNFKGTEMIMDIIYPPEETPIMKRAAEAGCKTCNGLPMLKYQGYMQFKLFTGVDYENA